MPSELSITKQTKGFFGNLFPRKKKEPVKTTEENSKVEELEKSLTKDDPLLASNTFKGDEEDERKNSKNKRREEESGVQDEEGKENLRSQLDGQTSVVIEPQIPGKELTTTGKVIDLVELGALEEANKAPTVSLSTADNPESFKTIWKVSSRSLHKFLSQISQEDPHPTEKAHEDAEIEKPDDPQVTTVASSHEKMKEAKTEQDAGPDSHLATQPEKTRRWRMFKFPSFAKKREDIPTTDNEENEDHSEEEEEKTAEVEAPVEKRLSEVSEEPSTSSESWKKNLLGKDASSDSVLDGKEGKSLHPTPVVGEEEGKPPRPTPRRRTSPHRDELTDENSVPKPARRRRRSRKSKAVKIKETATVIDGQAESSQVVADAEEVGEPPLEEGEDVLAIVVHQSDHLRADLKHMSHPVVKVTLVDGSNGSLLRKSSASRRVTSYYEQENVPHVLPIMTQPFDFLKNKSVLPKWEETIIFNESFQSMITQKNIQLSSTPREGEQEPPPIDTGILAPSPIIFFVIRDFVSMTKTNNQRTGEQDVTERGWHTIAWAFLKLVGADGKPNTGKRLRLQLYHPSRSTNATSLSHGQSEPAYFWWRDFPRQKYPSTLFVTVKPIKLSSAEESLGPSIFALRPEGGLNEYNQMNEALQFADKSKSRNFKAIKPKWTRLPGQSCKVPNAVRLRLWSASDGAFSVRFSNSGLLLAVACKHGTGFPVLLYGIPDGDEMGVLIGHQQIVYDIHWSNDDQKVLTSSGDGTAQVWDLSDKSKPTHVLPHPAYVYTGAFHPSAQHIIATGGYDSVVRVWNITTETAQILQELEGHKSFVNSLAFDLSHLTLYSVDSAGVVIAWNCHTHEQPKKDLKTSWSLKTKFANKDMAEVCINSVHVHKGNKKLLLHCRDSTTRMLDVRINTTLNFSGATNRRQFLRSALTPCGTFVISGSEDGCAYVWNAESSDQVAIYNELGFPRGVRDITFHPHEHMVAFCCFYPNMPVLVFKYDKDAASFGGELLSVVGSTSLPNLDETPSGLQDSPPANSLKIDRIKRQLDSVLPEPEVQQQPWLVAKKMLPVSMAVRAFSESKANVPSPIIAPSYLSSIHPDQMISPRRSELKPHPSYAYDPNSTRGSTFDSTSQLQPSYLSPHASSEAKVLARQFTSQQSKLEAKNTLGWRPSFAGVGGSPYRSDTSAGPDVSFTVGEDGNRSIRLTATSGKKHQEHVVALYDYQANRSDELTLVRGDVIKVLYKDGPSWWFGERISDAKQGYFPTNYVVAQGEEVTEGEPSLAVQFGVPTERPESADSLAGKTIHALKMESGKVRFYAQTDSEGEDDTKKASLSISSRQRRRDRRAASPARLTQQRTTASLDEAKKPPSSKTSAVRKLPSTPNVPEAKTSELKLPASPKTLEVELRTSPTDIDSQSRISQKEKPKASIPEKKLSRNLSVKKVVTPEVKVAEVRSSVNEASAPPDHTEVDALVDDAPVRPSFGVLKAVQAKMAEQGSLLSETVLDSDPAFARRGLSRFSALDPIMTSTATKNKKSKSRPKHRASKKSSVLDSYPVHSDEDAIPMVALKTKHSREGMHNPAYDDSVDLT